MPRKPKTQGLEWLTLSLASFNGSGYADKQTPEQYLASYRAFKMMKGDHRAVALLDNHWPEVLDWAHQLCLAKEAGHTPHPKRLELFRTFYNPDDVRQS